VKYKTPNLKIKNFLWLNDQLKDLSKQLKQFIKTCEDLEEESANKQLSIIENNFLIMQSRLNLEKKIN
jgi:hypothetical protein